MALTDANNGFYMPVAPVNGNGNGGFFGGDWAWILLLLLIGGGGWGFGGFGGGMDGLYPWLNNSQNISGGFRDQMLNTSISSIGDKITSGFGDVQTALCGGFAGVNATVNGAANSISQQLNAGQMASMNQTFGIQNGISDLKYTVATENCQDRAASYQNTRDIIDSQTRGTQAILDKLCALELDGVKGQLAAAQRENLSLQNAVNMASMRESQTAQTAQILAGQAAEIDGVYNRLKNCPVPSMPVYGNTPIFTCNGGCGCNGGF